MDKAEILKWARKYDKDQARHNQTEHELGSRFRRSRVLTLKDLTLVAEWKFKDQEHKKIKTLEAIAKNDDATLSRVSSQVFCIVGAEDAYRVNSLCMLNGVSPVLASVILAFFDPKEYGIFDSAVWRALLGNEPPNLYSTQNYLRLLASLRKVASKNNLDVRTVEKALFKKAANDS
jgi:hypothetical protein